MDYVETVPLSYFIDELMLLDGIEQAMAEDFIRKAVIDFCIKTQIVRRTTEVEFIACADEYILDIDDCERVVSIQSVCGYEVLKSPPCNTLNCYSHVVWFVSPNNLKFNPTPVESGGRVRVVVAVAPKQDCCEVDMLLYQNYREAIIDKALSLLYRIKQARWFDLNLAQIHEKDYQRGVIQAGADRLLGVKRGKIKMRGGIYG